MKLNIYFLIFALLLLGLGVFTFLLTEVRGTLFYLVQGVYLLLFVYLIVFYRQVIRPFKVIANGMDLLQEQDFSSRLIPVNQKESDRIVHIFNRMMNELKEERLRMREQNHFLDLLIQASPMGVIMMNLDEEITDMNTAALKLLRLDAVPEGRHMVGLNSPLATELWLLPRNTSKTIRLGDSGVYRCSHLSFLDRGFYHPFFLVESLTNEVMQAEKKAYEKVIRLIAHEVNNTTAGITSTLDSVCDALESLSGTDDLCEVMQVCVERCYGMSRFITNFADVVKIPAPQLVERDLNDTVSSCKRFMESICRGRDITLSIEPCEERLSVMLDSTLFEQVLVNIIKNSAESIGRDGEISIRMGMAHEGDTSFFHPDSASVSAPRSVLLEITDNGPGISREVESKLFTPFFSTKLSGQGLGLIFIREVLLNHHCTFSLRTDEDGFTRFSIYFSMNKAQI